MFSYVSPERRVPVDHPLRPIRTMVDLALKGLSRSLWKNVSGLGGGPRSRRKKLLRALLLQMLYSIRSERLLMEQLEYSLLFRWFVGLNVDEPVWVPQRCSVRIATGCWRARSQPSSSPRCSSRRVRRICCQGRVHFSGDGTLIEAWASQKRFQRKGDNPTPPPDDPGNPTVDFHGEERRNDTHASTTDPEAQRLARRILGTSRSWLIAETC